MSALVHYFFFGHPQLSILGFTAFYLLCSLVLGLVVRRAIAEALAVGFLILAGSANLGFFIARPIGISTMWFAPLVAAIAIAIAVALRRIMPGPGPDGPRVTIAYAFAALVLATMVWFTQIVIPLPSAGLSSNQVWFPLYIAGSYDVGHFLTWEELGFAPGFLASIYYGPDLVGLQSFGFWFGPDDRYAPYIAGAITGGMVSFSILCWGLRRDRLALLGFVVTAILVFRYGSWLRLVVGSNWGDVIMYAGGATVLYFLSLQEDRDDALLGAMACSLFLVFSRQFGGFFALVVCIGCAAHYWQRNGWRSACRAGIPLAAIGIVFAAREAYLLIARPTVFHQPGAHRQIDVAAILGDFVTGFSESDFWLEAPYRLAFVWVAAFYLIRRRVVHSRPDGAAIAMPFLLVAGPVLLLLITGFSSPFTMNKVYIVALFLPLWLPWALLAQDETLWGEARHRLEAWLRYRRRIVAGSAAGLLVIAAGLAGPRLAEHRLFRDGPETAFRYVFDTYRANNFDWRMVEKLRSALGNDFERRIVRHPILFLHYEPGIGIRYFAGGNFFGDIDFWSERVFAAMRRHDDLEGVMAELGWPHISIGWDNGLLYGRYATSDVWKKFTGDLARLDEEPWVERRFEVGYSRFYLVRENPVKPRK